MFVFVKEIGIGISIGLLIQLLSLLCIYSCLYCQKFDAYAFVSWLFSAISLVILSDLFFINGYIVSAGFTLPYLITLSIPYKITSVVGSDAAISFWMSGLLLIGTYAVLSLINFIKLFA